MAAVTAALSRFMKIAERRIINLFPIGGHSQKLPSLPAVRAASRAQLLDEQ